MHLILYNGILYHLTHNSNFAWCWAQKNIVYCYIQQGLDDNAHKLAQIGKNGQNGNFDPCGMWPTSD